MNQPIRIAVDIGGTFTDGIAEDGRDGRIWVGKCLTTPEDPGDGVSTVVAQLLARMAGTEAGALGAAAVGDVVHATTLVSNTLIERKGARVALVVTRGTADAPDIAREVRYDLYDLEIELPEPLVPPARRAELDERMGAGGVVLRPVAAPDLATLAEAVRGMAPDAVAICLLHAYANDAHERAVEEALRAALPADVGISRSARVAPEMREYERMSTTAANAYVQPLMAHYLGALERRLHDAGISGALRIMLSSGGFGSVQAAADVPIQLLESGPAAGVLSAVNTGAAAGERQILAFDMGGTTAKACVVTDAEPAVIRSFEAARVRRFKKGSGLPILVPSVDLIEIGAGGGSIAAVSAVGTLAVGPQSAGAVPGPVSYGRGGTEPTVTDADLMLGYLDAERFLGGEMRLDRDAAEAAFAALGARLGVAAMDAAWGVCSVVNEMMAGAARVHIAEKGFDPRRFTMVATGGAGPVHAVDVARRLRIGRVLCPLAAGAGSCLGLLAAAPRAERALARRSLLAEVDWPALAAALMPLRAEAGQELSAAGTDPAQADWGLSLDMRYVGQGHNVDVVLPFAEPGPALRDRMGEAFEARYRHLYGALVPDAAAEVVTWRLVGRARRATRLFRWADDRTARSSTVPRTQRPIFLPAERRFATAPVHDRYALLPGTALDGPLVLEERESTVVVPMPARVTVLPDLTLRIDLEGTAS